MVKVYPRGIDLDNVSKLKTFEETTVVASMHDLTQAIQARLKTLGEINT
jgi:flavoprotein